MEYRKLGRTGLTVSAVSLGCEHLQGKDYETIKSVIDAALDGGINFLDVFMSEPNVRTNIGKALAGRREQVIIQGHIGACWSEGQYKVSRDLAECVDAFLNYYIGNRIEGRLDAHREADFHNSAEDFLIDGDFPQLKLFCALIFHK